MFCLIIVNIILLPKASQTKPVFSRSLSRVAQANLSTDAPESAQIEVGAFYWTDCAPDIVNPGREEQGSVSV